MSREPPMYHMVSSGQKEQISRRNNKRWRTNINVEGGHIGESLKFQADEFIFDSYQLEQSWKPEQVFEQLNDKSEEIL